MLKKTERVNNKIAYKIPFRNTPSQNKWITVTLIGVYTFVAIFIALNN